MEAFPGTLHRSKRLGTPYVLTHEQEEWLRRYYPVTNDFETADAMGMKYTTMRRIAKRMGLKKDAASYSLRQSKAQRELRESERRRDRWGLPRKTTFHLPAHPYTKRQLVKRWRARKIFGYILDDDCTAEGGSRYKIYYDQNTRRNKVFEKFGAKHGFTFEPWNR